MNYRVALDRNTSCPSVRKGFTERAASELASTNNPLKQGEQCLPVLKLTVQRVMLVGATKHGRPSTGSWETMICKLPCMIPPPVVVETACTRKRVNENQGAESTLAFLMAQVEMRLLGEVDGPRSSRSRVGACSNDEV